MIGRTLAHYEIVARIGAGGMGEVYRANDPRLGRDVALKVLPEAVASNPDRLARFEREAKTLAALNHPHIVTIHSIEEADGLRFLTMELVEGDTLDRVVPAGGLPVDRVLDLCIALADALAAAHDQGVVHRDLKPGNVMVTRDGRIKVLDFGLAKPSAATAADVPEGTQAMTVESPISAAGVVLGTVPYMAPEQVRGETVDGRADLFALGILLYELLTGRRPFAGRSSADVSSAILRDTPPPVRTVRGDLPRHLERIVGRCLEKDCERRFQTARDVRNELEIVRRDLSSGPSGSGWAAPAAAPAAAPSSPSTPAHPTSEDGAPSIAVLPFANRSRDEEDEYFSDGLADELISVLAKIRGLRVAARTSSSTFKGKDATVAEIGAALGVATVLEGSVRKAGNRVRIAVQLVKVEDGYPLWSETYDRTLDDIFAVQDDIAQSVVKELRTTLLGEASDSKASGEARAAVAAAEQGRGENAEAHRLYLQGKHLVERLNRADTERGLHYLEQAVELDPSSAAAWVGLGSALANLAGYGWAPLHETFRRAREAVEHGLELAPDLAEAHVQLCAIQRTHDWDWEGALASSRRALELAPGSAIVLREAGSLARGLGRFDEAVEYFRRAVRQDPLSAAAHNGLGAALYSRGDLSGAIEAYRTTLELAPQRVTTRSMIGALLAQAGRLEEAMAEVNDEPAEWARLTSLAFIHHAAGRRDESDRTLNELKTRHGDTAGIQIAIVHTARGEPDQAFEWLERSYEQRDAGLTLLLGDPIFRRLQDDPRWSPFLKKMGHA